MKSKTFVTNSYKETQKVGENFARSLLDQGDSLQNKKKLVIVLHGDLGSGKTTFVQGLARGLGIKRRIISPTFIIVRQYQTRLPIYSSSEERSDESRSLRNNSSRQARTINFYHIDLYRTENESDIEGLGIKEIVNDSQNIVAIEWPEKMGNLLPEEKINIHFEYLGENKRRIIINNSLRHCEERSNLLH